MIGTDLLTAIAHGAHPQNDNPSCGDAFVASPRGTGFQVRACGETHPPLAHSEGSLSYGFPKPLAMLPLFS